MKKKLVCAATLVLFAVGATSALGDANTIKIGVVNDKSGPYADLSGKGSVVAAELAVEEFGGKVLGKPITVLSADHQNKPDIAATLVRKWFDVEGVDMVVDFPNSSTALAAQEIAGQKGKISVVSTGATTALTNKACSPTGFHWTYDTYSNAYPIVQELVKRGKDTWYYITADYAFGHALEADFRRAVEAGGAKSLGSAKHPLNASDFSSQVVAAQNSKAKVVVLANAGNDMINGVKAAGEFGLTKNQNVIIPVTFITDIKSLGLQAAQGMSYIDAYNTELDSKARAFVKKFQARHNGAVPSMGQIGVYSATLHFLKAVQAAGTVDGPRVAEKMRELKVNDAFVRNGYIRQDGRMMHDMYEVRVKSPAESKGPWDLVKYERVIPAEKAFKPLAESECALVKK